jgi:hypothetical protein
VAGRAAAEQENCIWLISEETMTSNFLKRSMPRKGPATAACRKVDVKSLPRNYTIFWIKPQEGIGWLSAPLRRGPDGLEFWLQGTMLKPGEGGVSYGYRTAFCKQEDELPKLGDAKLLQYQPNTYHWSIRQLETSSQHFQENA